MCGIVGGYGENVDAPWVSNQTTQLAYRGPDFQKYIQVNPKLHFGSARLAMTDPLPRSNQPFETERSVIVFNGEIYNYEILKAELESAGVKFETQSDTEVLLKSLDFWGDKATFRLEGMFAFAYFDKTKEILTLGRDSLGKKPLYFCLHKGSIYWSSSLKSLTELTPNSRLNKNAIFEYLSLGYVLDPNTINDNIHSVAPGKFLKLVIEDSKVKFIDSVNIPKRKNRTNPEKKFREELQKAVQLRVASHKSVAISLSGGVDSTVVALLAKEVGSNVTGYSAAWPTSDKKRYNSDSDSAENIANRIGIDFKRIDIQNEFDLDAKLKNYVKAMEEPNSNPTGLSMMSLYNNISEDGVRLVLTGDGADEILGGYPRYHSLRRVPNFLRIKSGLVTRYLEKERTNGNRLAIQGLITQNSNNDFNNWLHWHWNFTPEETKRLFPSYFTSSVEVDLRKSLNESSPEFLAGPVAFNMQLDHRIWLNMESNRKLDRISMFYSIEARSPFQDENVIDAALDFMEKDNFRTLDKKILRESFPELKSLGVRDDKAGFISPVGHWLRANEYLVNSSLVSLSDHMPLDNRFLSELRDAPLSGNYRRIMQLWSLVVLSYWFNYSK
jgi:asparagine synthase (glutamine-hydrolysing)